MNLTLCRSTFLNAQVIESQKALSRPTVLFSLIVQTKDLDGLCGRKFLQQILDTGSVAMAAV